MKHYPTIRRASACLLSVFGPALGPARALPSAPQWNEVAKLAASDAEYRDELGWSVSLSGDTLVVGAAREDSGGVDAGAAYVYVRGPSGWTEQAKLTASDAQADDFFGLSAAISGDTIVVGAFEAEIRAGKAYVFVRSGTTWSQQAKLTANDGLPADGFGITVSISGDTVLVGAPRNDMGGTNTGAAYVFERSGAIWSQQAKLSASDRAAGDIFASAVSLFGDDAVIGSPGNDHLGSSAGAAYVFVRAGGIWSEQGKLTASDGQSGDDFGHSVSTSGGDVLIGAFQDDDGGAEAGSAYVFTRSGTTWTQQAKLTSSEPAPGTWYGNSVAISGSLAVVGAYRHDGIDHNSGAAYVYVRSGAAWSQHAKLTAHDEAWADEFGSSIALSGNSAAFGAYGGDDACPSDPYCNSGAAYVFELDPGTGYCYCAVGPCGNSDPGAGCLTSSGSGALLSAEGTSNPDTIRLVISGAPALQFGIFFQGNGRIGIPFGDGFLCAGGGVIRMTAPRRTSATGEAVFPGAGDPPISVLTGVTPGSGVTKRYQFWFRDPFGPCGTAFSTSNGYEITW